MKIGTLTLHLPFNYGNALQMLSLHRYLLEQGYDAEVISHWAQKDRGEILNFHHEIRSFWRCFRFLFDCLTFDGVFCNFMRERKIVRWLNEMIKWSVEQGNTDDLDVAKINDELLIVGSDQVWNPAYDSSEYYLAADFPTRMRLIAYAASFGTDSFPPERQGVYARALKRFEAISVREPSAVKIVESLGAKAQLVCDPVLLHTEDEWRRMLKIGADDRRESAYVAYFVTPDFRDYWRDVLKAARTSDKKIHVYVFEMAYRIARFSLRHPINSFLSAVQRIKVRVLLYWGGVRLHFSATPSEFVKKIAMTDGVITDSFHGTVLATIFNKKCNVVIGDNPTRQQMRTRIVEFVHRYLDPAIITSKIDVSSMRTVSVPSHLRDLIEYSKCWLSQNIGE